jgi:hypothetical protein
VVGGVGLVVGGTGVPGAVVVGTGMLVDVVGAVVVGAPVVVGAVVPVVGSVAVVVGAGAPGAVVVGAVAVLAVADVVAAPDVVTVPELSCVSSSASRIPTMTARTPAAMSAASGPRRRWKFVPQFGQKSASAATGIAQTGHGRTDTGAPPAGGAGVDIARDATGAGGRVSGRHRR